jgi:hypothetical protein
LPYCFFGGAGQNEREPTSHGSSQRPVKTAQSCNPRDYLLPA